MNIYDDTKDRVLSDEEISDNNLLRMLVREQLKTNEYLHFLCDNIINSKPAYDEESSWDKSTKRMYLEEIKTKNRTFFYNNVDENGKRDWAVL